MKLPTLKITKRFVAVLLAVDKKLNYLLLLALVAVILIDVVFVSVPELFPGGARIVVVIHAISLAFIASYIFYFVVVHLKQTSDKRNIQPFVALKTKQIVNGIRAITHAIVLHTGNDPEEEKYPSKAKLADMCEHINPYGPAPETYRRMGTGDDSWMDYLMYWKENTEERLSEIFLQGQYLESAHVGILLRIQQSSFFSALDLVPSTILNEDLTFLSGPIYDLSESAKSLESYCNQQFKNVEQFKQ